MISHSPKENPYIFCVRTAENRLFFFLAEGFGRHPCHALEKFPEEANVNKVQFVGNFLNVLLR